MWQHVTSFPPPPSVSKHLHWSVNLRPGFHISVNIADIAAGSPVVVPVVCNCSQEFPFDSDVGNKIEAAVQHGCAKPILRASYGFY